MKTAVAIVMTLALMTVCGCARTTMSPQGGILPQDKEFSITVPTSNTIKQGADLTVTILLNRGAYFKRDVLLDIAADGISVTPTNVLVRASDKPDVKLHIAVGRDAALGEYRVSVKGTPETGEPTTTAFTVKVVSP